MTSGLETEWDYSGRMGMVGKARKYRRRETWKSKIY